MNRREFLAAIPLVQVFPRVRSKMIIPLGKNTRGNFLRRYRIPRKGVVFGANIVGSHLDRDDRKRLFSIARENGDNSYLIQANWSALRSSGRPSPRIWGPATYASMIPQTFRQTLQDCREEGLTPILWTGPDTYTWNRLWSKSTSVYKYHMDRLAEISGDLIGGIIMGPEVGAYLSETQMVEMMDYLGRIFVRPLGLHLNSHMVGPRGMWAAIRHLVQQRVYLCYQSGFRTDNAGLVRQVVSLCKVFEGRWMPFEHSMAFLPGQPWPNPMSEEDQNTRGQLMINTALEDFGIELGGFNGYDPNAWCHQPWCKEVTL